MQLQHQPRHHDVVTIRTRGRLRGMRVIVTADGVLPSLVAYFLAAENVTRSPAWQADMARAVGLLYDYTVACPPSPDDVESGEYLSAFVRSLMGGTVAEDGSDPTGLRWHAPSRTKVLATLRSVNHFTDWCARTFKGAPANPLRAATYGERLASLRRIEAQNEASLLLHLDKARAWLSGDAREDAEDRGDAPAWARTVQVERPHKVAPARPPFFPREHTSALLVRGFRRTPVEDGEFWEQVNIRDLMITLLWRYGGLRRAEPLHLFVGDVLHDPTTGGARVLLFHPQDGLSPPYRHPRTGQTVETTRTEYLKSMWGLVPRNREVQGRRAGWKNLMLEKGEPHLYANVHWLDDDASRLFWVLREMYLRHVRPRGLPHPYLFCNGQGAPLSYEHTGTAFRAAVGRIGLASSKEAGTTPHGLRHAYGQDLKDAGMPKEHVQICMHHNEVTSQRVYTAPVLAEVDASLSSARRQLNAEGEALVAGLLASATRSTR